MELIDLNWNSQKISRMDVERKGFAKQLKDVPVPFEHSYLCFVYAVGKSNDDAEKIKNHFSTLRATGRL